MFGISDIAEAVATRRDIFVNCDTRPTAMPPVKYVMFTVYSSVFFYFYLVLPISVNRERCV